MNKRPINLINSNSYVFLGRGVGSRDTKSQIAGATKSSSLMRDDFLFFELIFHSQDNSANEEGNTPTNTNTKTRDPNDYSIHYHNWTLRQLYRHVVSSVKIQSPAGATQGETSGSSVRRRSRSHSISEGYSPAPPFASPPPPSGSHLRATSTGSAVSSRLQRQNSIAGTINNNNNNNTATYETVKLLGSNLHPRDMRRLVTPFSASNEPELIVRRHVMVFNFDPLRAIITRDRLLVLVPNGADSLLKNLEERIVGSSFEYDGYTEETDHIEFDNNPPSKELWKEPSSSRLSDVEEGVPKNETNLDTNGETFENKDGETFENKNEETFENKENEDDSDDDDDGWSEMMMMELEGEHNELTFELLCVNACLSTVFEMLADDTRELQDKGLKLIQDRVICDRRGRSNRNKPQQRPLKPEDALAVIRNLKNAVKVMQARVKGFVHSLNRILNEDEDMALMNLSRLISHPEHFVQPISQEFLEAESDEPELVLESNLHNALTLSNALDLIQGQVDTASDLIDARMDAARNKFLLATLCITIASLCLSAISCVSSIFGMNLTNHYETDPTKFVEVTFGSIAGSVVLGILILAGFIMTGVITGIGPVDQDGIDTLF